MIKAVIFFIVLLLKIIGILTLAGLLLFACLLLVPVRYTVKVENSRVTKPPELPEPAGKNNRFYYNIQINVSWFLHAIRYTFDYSSDGTSGTLRVFGFDLQKLSAKWKSRRKRSKQKNSGTQESQKNKSHESASGKPEQTELERAELEKINDGESDSKKSDLKESDKEKTDKRKTDKEESDISKSDLKKSATEKASQKKTKHKKESFRKTKHVQKKNTQKKKAAHQKEDAPKKGRASSIRDRFRAFHKEFTDQTNRQAVAHIWKELLFLLRSFKPKKIKADLAFSLADPAFTGNVLGFFSMFPYIYKYPCRIIPDFNSEVVYVEGEFFAKGKITVIVFLISLLRLWRDKEFKHVFNRVTGRG